MIFATFSQCIGWSVGTVLVVIPGRFCHGSRPTWDTSTCWAPSGISKPLLKLKRNALEAFWAAAGLSSTKRKAWRPSPKLSQFLQSI